MAWLIALAALTACQAGAAPAASATSAVAACDMAERAWRRAATATDSQRLRQWRPVFLDAIAQAQQAGDIDAPSADDPLYDPDRALDKPLPPPGAYRCRIVKLGAHDPRNRRFVTLPPAACTVAARDGGGLTFAVTGGMQRPIGRLYDGPPGRGVFLGTLELGDEKLPVAYRADERRDMIGYIDRIGAARWRIILPKPHFDSLADVIEITSAG